jgi:hypothetical protein
MATKGKAKAKPKTKPKAKQKTKPKATLKDLSPKKAPTVKGGFAPQPEPPGRTAIGFASQPAPTIIRTTSF